MKGRKLGSISVTQREINLIVELTKQDVTRGEIAKAVNRSKDTVWRYQTKLGLM